MPIICITHMKIWIGYMVPTYPTMQNKMQSSLQSIHECDLEAGTYTILTSWTNNGTVPASCSTYRAACQTLGAQMGPLKMKKADSVWSCTFNKTRLRHIAVNGVLCLTSCRGNAPVKAPSFRRRATPTSARFLLPYTVLAKISYTCDEHSNHHTHHHSKLF